MLGNLFKFGAVSAGEVKNMVLSEDNPLREIVPDHKIKVQEFPYRHIVVDNFFEESFYKKLCEDFEAFLSRGLVEGSDMNRFTKIGSFDAYSVVPNPHEDWAANRLRTPEWQKYIETLFDVEVNGDEIMTYHHHKPGSASGEVHNDFVISSFVDDPLPNGINSWWQQCKYEHSFPDAQLGARQSVRAFTILYYLNNECDGKFGGSTGIYKDGKLVKEVAPVNNRMFMFEVSPFSDHTFISNTTYARNSLIQWFHQDPSVIARRFDTDQFITW